MQNQVQLHLKCIPFITYRIFDGCSRISVTQAEITLLKFLKFHVFTNNISTFFFFKFAIPLHQDSSALQIILPFHHECYVKSSHQFAIILSGFTSHFVSVPAQEGLSTDNLSRATLYLVQFNYVFLGSKKLKAYIVEDIKKKTQFN